MRYAGGVKSRADIERLLNERILDYYAQHPGMGMWATIERATGTCIGQHHLNHIHGESIVQVGYLLFPAHWGRGYATEMSIRVLRYGFGELGIERIAGITELARRARRCVTGQTFRPVPGLPSEKDAVDWLPYQRFSSSSEHALQRPDVITSRNHCQ